MTKLIERMILSVTQSIPDIHITDVVEMVILAILIYNIMLWVKNTRAWVLLKGVVIFLAFILFAFLLQMDTILFIAGRLVNIGIIALVIIFQPELRHALEQLGQNRVLGFIMSDNAKDDKNRFSDRTAAEIGLAAAEMSKAKTGALIVIEKRIPLAEYERTGIEVDAVLTRQLLLNIFEKNTPLHDGAIVVRGNRVTAATCYLPLSDNMQISKDLGTRHRAGLGVSEATDSVTVIVSEETGAISVAHDGKLFRGLSADALRNKLMELIGEPETKNIRRGLKLLKGRQKNEENAQ